jgi:hypothetical protein
MAWDADKRQLARRQAAARKLAQAFTGHDPETLVVPDFIAPMRIRGGFHSLPMQQAAPLWTFFLEAVEALEPPEDPK